jgi:hypothetical protein
VTARDANFGWTRGSHGALRRTDIPWILDQPRPMPTDLISVPAHRREAIERLAPELIAGRRVAIDDLAVLRPNLEVAEPDARRDSPEHFPGGRAQFGRQLQVHRQAQLQAVALGPPGEPQLVVLPVAGQGEGQVAVLGAVEGQVLGGQDVLDHVERIEADVFDVVVLKGGVHQSSLEERRRSDDRARLTPRSGVRLFG